MTIKKFFHRLFFCFIFWFILCLIGFILFKPIYLSNSIIIPYSLHPYDICITKPDLWRIIKICFIIFYIISSIIYSNFLYSLFFRKYLINKEKIDKKNNNLIKPISNSKNLFLFVGKNENDNLVYIPEKSLYQNILITGTIGSGKTSSCMYPFT